MAEVRAGERARELAEKLIVWDYSETSPTAHPKPRIDLDVLTEALATSAREARLEEARERAIVWELRPASGNLAGDEIRLERRDGFKGRRWAITQRGYVLNKSGEWEFEPIPSSRTEEWLSTVRWITFEAALKAGEKAAHAQIVQAVATQGQPSTVVENEPSGELD